MPHLDFYALGEDYRRILEFVFGCGRFRVFELASQPDCEVIEFSGPEQLDDGGLLERGALLQLFPFECGGSVFFRRCQLRPGAWGEAGFRWSCEGWGLIQLYLQVPHASRLRPSHTNHFSQAKALAVSTSRPELGEIGLWDWKAVEGASRRLNRHIQGLGVAKSGNRPVLAAAAAAQGHLEFLPG